MLKKLKSKLILDKEDYKTTKLVPSRDWETELRKLALPSTAATDRWAGYRHLIGHEAQGQDLRRSTQLAHDAASDIGAGDLVLVLRSNHKWTYAEVLQKTESEVSVSVDVRTYPSSGTVCY